jgi:YVTN family beta-propeller protein
MISRLPALSTILMVVFLWGVGNAGDTTLIPDLAEGNGRVLLPNGFTLSPAGNQIVLRGDVPHRIVIDPAGKHVLVDTGGYHNNDVDVIDVADQKVIQSENVGKDWGGLAIDPKSHLVFVSGGAGKFNSGMIEAPLLAEHQELLADQLHFPILKLSLSKDALTLHRGVRLPDLQESDRFISGLTVDKQGDIFALSMQTNRVYRISGTTFQSVSSAAVGQNPFGIALSPDGAQLAVTNMGDGTVSLLSTSSLSSQGTIHVGKQPNDLVYGSDGRLFVANAGSDSISIIKNGAVTETVMTTSDLESLLGAVPDALAISANARTLYVADAGINAVSVLDVGGARTTLLGYIPTAWYPTALALATDGSTLYVGSAKGLRSRPNFPAYTSSRWFSDRYADYDYLPGVLTGVLSIVPVPTVQQLRGYSDEVTANLPKPAVVDPAIVTNARRGFSRIKHVLYIIRENRTYDQVLGDDAAGNGDAELALFGRTTTPNAHKLADSFVLLDNLYCDGDVSEDGHPWSDGAYASNFTERSWPSSYSGRGEADVDDDASDSPAGELWDSALRRGLSVYDYGEGYHYSPTGQYRGPAQLRTRSNRDFGSWNWMAPGDVAKAKVFIHDLNAAEKTGIWPNLIVISLPQDHTAGAYPGVITPIAAVATNDAAIGMMVDAVSHSRFWRDTAIFVIEDDAQDGPDHVDDHRTVGLVVSPYVRRGVVDSTLYTTSSYLRTMELILGLPPMTAFDSLASPLYASFTDKPNFEPYAGITPNVDLNAKNPPRGPDEQASLKMDFSAPDHADPYVLNEILWHVVHTSRVRQVATRR